MGKYTTKFLNKRNCYYGQKGKTLVKVNKKILYLIQYNKNTMSVKKVSFLWPTKENPVNISCSESLVVTPKKGLKHFQS